MRTLTDAEVRAAVSMPAAVEAVRGAFLDLAAGAFELPQRAVLREGGFLVMPVHHRPSGSLAVKTLSLSATREPRIAGSITWTDLEHPEPLVLPAAAVTAIRTGAVSGVATDLLAPPDAHRLSVVGAGAMAPDQARAVHAVRPITALTITARHRERAEALAQAIGTELGIAAHGTDDVAAAVADADVVCCATPATAPLFALDDLAPHAHVNAVGSYRPAMRELPDALLADADPVLVDDLAAVLEESGEVRHALGSGAIAESDLVELGEALTTGVRRGPGRSVFKSVGVAVQDWALAALVAAAATPDRPSAPRVLVIGLDPTRVPGPWDPEPVLRALAAGRAEFAAHGIDDEECLVGLDGSDDVPVVVEAALRAGRWDCVVVGGGIRTDESRLELFETIVNLVHRHAPDAAIAFNARPDDCYAAAARRLR